MITELISGILNQQVLRIVGKDHRITLVTHLLIFLQPAVWI